MKKEKTFNFGKWGWILIFVCIMYQMVYSCFAVDGINGYGSSLAAMLSQKSGAQVTSDMLVMVLTPIGILACLGNIGFSSLVFKFGAKKVALVSCAVMAVSVFLFGNVSTYPQYVVCLLVTTLSGYSLAYACHHGLVGTWFPTKKGIVMGFTTMGLPLTSMIGLPYVTWCFAGKLGWRGFCYTITVIILILIVVTALFISNMPEERGVYPDNISKDHAEKMQDANDLKYFKSRYTMKSLLKNKSVWMICIGFGLPWATTAGVMSQLINRIMSTGYFESITGPVAIISGATIVGILGSFFWGWLDTKIGTKKAGVFFNLAYVVVLLIMIFLGSLPKVFCVIVTCMCTFCGGGIPNLMPSMVISKFGRYEFLSANRICTPLATIFANTGFFILVAGKALTGGSWVGAYGIFIVLCLIGALVLFKIDMTKEVDDEEIEREMKKLAEADRN